jgi:hypothetical protein
MVKVKAASTDATTARITINLDSHRTLSNICSIKSKNLFILILLFIGVLLILFYHNNKLHLMISKISESSKIADL